MGKKFTQKYPGGGPVEYDLRTKKEVASKKEPPRGTWDDATGRYTPPKGPRPSKSERAAARKPPKPPPRNLSRQFEPSYLNSPYAGGGSNDPTPGSGRNGYGPNRPYWG